MICTCRKGYVHVRKRMHVQGVTYVQEDKLTGLSPSSWDCQPCDELTEPSPDS